MPFIGNQPALSYTSFAKQDFTTSATTSYTLDNPVANANEIALFINFVRQEPTTAYTASGTTLTLTSATSATDDMYCVFLGKAVQTVNPPNGSVTNAMLSSGSFSNITGVGTLSSGLTLSDNILFDTASKGIYLGVTSATASNLLDDYEEGTWTPTYTGVTTNPTVVYFAQRTTYTKIGNRVFISGDIATTSVSSAGSGQIRISGLPFVAEGYGGGISVTGNNDWGTNNNPSMGQIFTGSTDITLYKYPADPQDEFVAVDAALLGSGSNDNLVRFFGAYRTLL
jgi:hypothetical protein